MSTEEKNETVGADVAPVKKYKMSEIIEALKNREVETDCDGYLFGFIDNNVHSLLDVGRLDFHRGHDLRKMIVHHGMPMLVIEALHAEPEALAAFAAASGRATSREALHQSFRKFAGMMSRNNDQL